MKGTLKVAAAVCCLAAICAAATTTAVSIPVNGATGLPATGAVTITPSVEFTAGDGTHVEMQTVTVHLANGLFAAKLVPTDTAVPAATYTVVWQIDGAKSRTETWRVPTTTSTLGWTSVISSVPSTGSGSVATLTIDDDGTVVGTRPAVNFLQGSGILQAISDTGAEIDVQTGIDTSVVETFAAAQSGSALLCNSASGSASTYTCAVTPILQSYAAGMVLDWVPDVSGSGGATTLNVSTLGAKSVKLLDGATNPASSDIIAGSMRQVWYDGTNFRFMGPAPGTGGGGGGGAAPAPVFGAYASRPACASTNTGQLFHASDIGNKHWECDGTTWQPVAFDMQVVEPTALTWSTMVSGGSNTPTITSVAGAVQLSATNPGGSGYNFQGMLTPLSMTTPYTIEIAFTLEQLSAGMYTICQWGVADGNSPASNFLGQGWGNPAGGGAETVFVSAFNAMGVAGRGIQAPPIVSQPVTRVKMVDDGTNRGWYYNTGSGWHLQFSEGDTADVSSPTYWGIGCSLYGTDDQFQLTLYHASVHH
jgi:hypothetical protein